MGTIHDDDDTTTQSNHHHRQQASIMLSFDDFKAVITSEGESNVMRNFMKNYP
jgi:hypothetical protein